MPRLVRRRPLLERIQAHLNPWDFLLWLSEEFETRDWDSKQSATPIALGLHLVLLVARANSSTSGRNTADDVFGDVGSGSGWLNFITTFVVHLLTYLSIANAAYTFLRKRHYRLFESSIDTPQNTPSAHRVRVDSSPVSSSPLRFIQNILGDTSAESRAHPDPTRDVWQLAVWDPIPVCLRLFCLFSPGHVLVYWLFLPTSSLDPRPSMTVFTTLILEILLSAQLLLLQSNFSQQVKDTALINKEVLSEYDTKYVHPRLNPLVRDVATQFSGSSSGLDYADGQGDVDTYTPTIILKRSFYTNPNPNYAKHIDPENTGATHQRLFSPTPSFQNPASNNLPPKPFGTPQTAIRQPQFRQSVSGAVSTGSSTSDGGSLGIYSHANSPLKKATSMYDIQRREAPRNSFDLAAREIQEDRERTRSKSPEKFQNTSHRALSGKGFLSFADSQDISDRRTSAPTAGRIPRPPSTDSPLKRGPSRW